MISHFTIQRSVLDSIDVRDAAGCDRCAGGRARGVGGGRDRVPMPSLVAIDALNPQTASVPVFRTGSVSVTVIPLLSNFNDLI